VGTYQELQNSIFNGAIKSKYCRNMLLDELRVNIFSGEVSVIYDILERYKYIDSDLLSQSLDMNKSEVVNSEYGNSFQSQGGLEFNEKFTVLKNGIMEGYERILRAESGGEVDEDRFQAQLKQLKLMYTEDYYRETIVHLGMIMSPQGFYNRLTRKTLQGMDNAVDYNYRRGDHIDDVNAVDRDFEHIVLDERQLPVSQAGQHIGREIVDFGIPEIDNAMDKIRGGNLVCILGPPKGGKTSTLIHLALRAILNKENVLIWLTEAEWYEWEAGLMAAYYIHSLKEEGTYVLNDEKSELSSSRILECPPKYAGTIAVLRSRLYTDANLGRIQFIKGAAVAETFIDVLKSKEKSHPFTFLVFDSPVLATSETMDKFTGIGHTIKSLKSYLSNHRRGECAGAMSAQFKQHIIEQIRKYPDREIGTDAGGDSAESIRTPDYALGVFSTEAERAANRQAVYGIASRHSQLPRRIDIGMDYGAKHMYSLQ
jgi:hypothetical protein